MLDLYREACGRTLAPRLEPKGSSGTASWASGFSHYGEHAQQQSDRPPRSYKLGTRRISGPLANTTEGNFILAQLLIQRIIKFVDEHANAIIYIFLAVFFDLL